MKSLKKLFVLGLISIGACGASYGDNNKMSDEERGARLFDAVSAKVVTMDDVDMIKIKDRLIYIGLLYQKKFPTKDSQPITNKLLNSCKKIIKSSVNPDQYLHDLDVVIDQYFHDAISGRFKYTQINDDFMANLAVKPLNEQYKNANKLCIEYLDAYIDDLEN